MNPKDFCRRFNRGRCTFGKTCRYEHRCTYCFKFGHGFHNCRKAAADRKEKEAAAGGGNDPKPLIAHPTENKSSNCFIPAADDQGIKQFCNFDLESIVTPIYVPKFKAAMQEAGYDPNKAEFLIDGFTKGFDFSYRGPQKRKHYSANIPLKNIGTESDLWNKIMNEVELGRYAGPYNAPPFDNFMQSPVGLVPKAGNKTRLIFHLSYDFGEEDLDKSFNFHTDKNLCSVQYRDLDMRFETVWKS